QMSGAYSGQRTEIFAASRRKGRKGRRQNSLTQRYSSRECPANRQRPMLMLGTQSFRESRAYRDKQAWPIYTGRHRLLLDEYSYEEEAVAMDQHRRGFLQVSARVGAFALTSAALWRIDPALAQSGSGRELAMLSIDDLSHHL